MVQVMSFPVIAVERYFSISHPFERELHLKRVTYLNSMLGFAGGRQGDDKAPQI